MQLKVSKRARMNLRQIGHYYLKTGGLVLAETMLDRIESRFDQLLKEYLKNTKGWGCGGRASAKQLITD